MHLTLAARDLNFTEIFYRDLLDQPVKRLLLPGGTPALELPAESPLLRFLPLADFQRRHPLLLASLDRGMLGQGLLLQLEAAHVRRTLARLRRDNIPILYELEDDEHCRHEFWLHDPDNYLVSVSGPL